VREWLLWKRESPAACFEVVELFAGLWPPPRQICAEDIVLWDEHGYQGLANGSGGSC
jgi:hypothetical protein